MTDPAPPFTLTFGPYRNPVGAPLAAGLTGVLRLVRAPAGGGATGGAVRVRLGADSTAAVAGLTRGTYRMDWGYEVSGGPRARTFTVTADDLAEVSYDTVRAPDSGGDVFTTPPFDHGLLGGRADDDHPQYLTEGRADARYLPLGAQLAGGVDLAGYVSDDELAAALAGRAPAQHTHPAPNLAGYVSDDELAAALSATLTSARQRATHTGTQTLDTTTDTATRLALAPAERTKLAGVETGATANATDAALRDRATHTGTQTTATITDLREYVEDTVGGMLRAVGADLDISYDDAAGTLTIDYTGVTTDPEAIRDTIGAAMVGLGNITVLVNDAADTITITTAATVNATDAALRDRATHTGVQSLDTTTDSVTRLALAPAERTKLSGVAAGATANATDAQLRDRATHTGVQAAATISDFGDAAQAALDPRLDQLDAAVTGKADAAALAAETTARTDADTALSGRVGTAETTLTAATDLATNGAVVRRSATGSAQFTQVAANNTAPTQASHLTRKDYVDALARTGPAPATLTDAATIATDASLGTLFEVTIAGNRTLGAPTNPTNGQRALWAVTASGADRTLTLATGAAGSFRYGTDVTTIPVITAGTTTFVGAVYRATSARWHVLAVGAGH